MDFNQEIIFCRKRFMNWVKNFDSSFHFKDIDNYYSYYQTYISKLNLLELKQEWRTGSDWKRKEIYKLVSYYKKLGYSVE